MAQLPLTLAQLSLQGIPLWQASGTLNNTGIDITVPLANDASLTDGTLLMIRVNVNGRSS